MRLAPAYRKRFGDFQPDQGIAVSDLFSCHYSVALRLKITGDSSALEGEGENTKNGNEVAVLLLLRRIS